MYVGEILSEKDFQELRSIRRSIEERIKRGESYDQK